MSYYVVDIESDGPIPHKYSMVSFGAVKVTPSLDQTFYGETKPVSEIWIPEALAISGFSREEHESFGDPFDVIPKFAEWLLDTSIGKPILISDNNGYDASWINYYMHMYNNGKNPFGWSSRRIGDLYCGLVKDSRAQWKHLRDTKHSHQALEDAIGNAEVLLKMQKLGLKITLT
jgi:DNA polymerase III epsilon subunit-like protein